MHEYYFEFTIEITGLDSVDFDDILYESGCDDGLIFQSAGRTWVDFCRLASTYDDAVQSAITNLQDAGATIIKVERIWGSGIIIAGEDPPTVLAHNPEAIIERYTRNVKHYVEVVVNAGRKLLSRKFHFNK